MLLKKNVSDVPRLVTIVEELKDGFCTLAVRGEFIYLNLAAAEMLELKEDKNEYNFFEDVVKDKKHIEYIKKTLEQKSFIKDYEIDLYSKLNKKFPVLLTVNYIKDPTNSVIGMSVLIKDMTYIKKMQQQLLQAQKMESIGMLASGVAHEFNNILTGIIPNAELIKMTIEPQNSNYNRAEAIQNSAYRAAEIVKKLLNFARNDKEKKGQVIDFKKAARETIDIIRKLFDRSIDIDVKFADNLNHVKMDATSLQQIIMNLSINAKDAMSGEGKITFTARNYFNSKDNVSRYKDLAPGKYVYFQVSDTGQGIDTDKLEYIFDPFYTTKSPGKGTGLGLSMVYGIVNSLDGKIEVNSTPKVGTIFKLYFPAAERSRDKDATEFIIKPIGQGQSILVIDDEKMIREMARDMLNILGFNVLLAASGIEGLDLYKNYQKDISLVVLDLLMPEMSGKTCFENLKLFDPEVKVIIASGMGELEKKKELEQMGIVAYLEKPYRLEHMTEKIKLAIP